MRNAASADTHRMQPGQHSLGASKTTGQPGGKAGGLGCRVTKIEQNLRFRGKTLVGTRACAHGLFKEINTSGEMGNEDNTDH